MVTERERLRRIVLGSRWLAGVLETVRASGLPEAWVGAGVLRDLVWDGRDGNFDPARVRDVDVPYFDPGDLRRERDDEADRRLRELDAAVPWEAKNQAAVHLWYAAKFEGTRYLPATSIEDAIARWPETATSVVVRLDDLGRLEILAPCGLADLLGGVWRRNPAQVSVERSRVRLQSQRVHERWPWVRVIAP
ncbi:MAG: nucleotidyltransferase family protein [Candidatus Dormibacteraceae bacterium]